MDTKNVFTKTFSKKQPVASPEPEPETVEMIESAAPKKTEKRVGQRRSAALAPPLVGRRAVSFDSEQIVRSIHQQKEEMQRITVDMPKEIYQLMKVHLAHENVSIRDFIVRLVDVYLTKNNIR